jgi:hypothetical protein
MRERARQVKVQEKLKQMTDITWYEEFLQMIPQKRETTRVKSLSGSREIVEQRMLNKIKR